jgi:PhzF family phenazine biosynthesis protein
MELYHVDAFTNKMFSGNPAGVLFIIRPTDGEWMQNVAREINLSETAFLQEGDKENFTLRGFTPNKEVDLCGHATLASAHILWEPERLDEITEARFRTKSGVVTAKKIGEWIELYIQKEEDEETDAPPELLTGLV